jgi:hypothetical protein
MAAIKTTEETFVRNLGVYRCSCLFMYSIGNCGYAVMRSKCPKCGADIGGEGHQMLQRDNHYHLKTIPEIFGVIKAEYDKDNDHYNMHTVINRTSIELFPLKFIEMGTEKFMDNRKAKGNNNNLWQIFYTNLFVRHLFDHMYLTILPETLSAENKKEYQEKMNKIIDFSKGQTKELYSKMSGKTINNYIEYFLAHVKNDIDTISKELHFENPVDIFDWLRAILSNSVEKIHFEKTNFSDAVKNPMLTEIEITEPQQVLIVQNSNIEAMVCTEVSTKYIVKNMFFRKVDGNLLYDQMREYKEEMHNIYQFCRHNKYDRTNLMKEFEKQLLTSEFTLLKQIVKYKEVLKDFARMVKANVDISYYLMENYGRLYNLEE